MDSEIDIYNAALIEIGQTPLLGPVDDSKEARACNYRYPDARDSTLRSHYWNCAMARADLAQLATAPIWGWSYAHQLPVDCLRVKETEPCDIEWKIEGRRIVSNSPTMKILYVARITNVPDMDDLLCQAISLKLGASIAYYMTRNEKLSQLLMSKWMDTLAEARYMDSLEQKGDVMQPVLFTSARLGGDGLFFRPF